jgi:hypothetical protein
MIIHGIDCTKNFEQAAAMFGVRAAEFIKAMDWTKDFQIAASDYAYDAKTAAMIAGHFAFAARPEWREWPATEKPSN